jgi:polyferredoxin
MAVTFFVVLGFALIFRRFFCYVACPVGALQHLLWQARGKVFKWFGLWVPAKAAAVFRGIAFGLMLVLGLLVTPAVGLFAIIDPFLLFSPPEVLNVTMAITIVLLVFSFFINRPFCRLLCPFGFMVGVIARLRRPKPKAVPPKPVSRAPDRVYEMEEEKI